MNLDPKTELVELHLHVGGAVAPHVLWAIAHDSGFKLPVKSFWDFCELVYADPNKVSSLGDYLDKGVLAEGNAPLVARAVEICQRRGRAVATVTEARQLLGLRSSP